MPVNKRAARPTAASAPDPRDPQSSENDFTVLFDRKRTDQLLRGFTQARQVQLPKPAPKPPFPGRSKWSAAPRGDGNENENESGAESTPSAAPPGMVVPTRAQIQTVAVPPRLRARVLRIAVFLALGGTVGVGVESVARHPPPGAPAADPLPLVKTEPRPAPSALVSAGPQDPAGASISLSNDKVVLVPPAHHHHHHHAQAGSPSSAASAVSAGPAGDAGAEADDVNAAIETLSQAKGEVTLP